MARKKNFWRKTYRDMKCDVAMNHVTGATHCEDTLAYALELRATLIAHMATPPHAREYRFNKASQRLYALERRIVELTRDTLTR